MEIKNRERERWSLDGVAAAALDGTMPLSVHLRTFHQTFDGLRGRRRRQDYSGRPRAALIMQSLMYTGQRRRGLGRRARVTFVLTYRLTYSSPTGRSPIYEGGGGFHERSSPTALMS